MSGGDLITRDDVDAVVIAAPGHTHADLVLTALAHHKFVFCEKPLATDLTDAREILNREVAIGKRMLQLGFMRQFDERYLALKAIIGSGKIGDIGLLTMSHRNPSVPDWWTDELTVRDSFVHDIDVVRFLTGDEIASVHVRPAGRPSGRFDYADHLVFTVRTNDGLMANVELSVAMEYGYEVTCDVVGVSGVASLEGGSVVRWSSSGARHNGVESDWRERFGPAYDAELTSWVNSTLRGVATGPSSWDGFVAAHVAEAAYQSMVSGRETFVETVRRPEIYNV
jgi:myo-inositol 2-dehydrogenase/D-chiro-inositol 1-dehydrogenase